MASSLNALPMKASGVFIACSLYKTLNKGCYQQTEALPLIGLYTNVSGSSLFRVLPESSTDNLEVIMEEFLKHQTGKKEGNLIQCNYLVILYYIKVSRLSVESSGINLY
jgi:hypothetical protein